MDDCTGIATLTHQVQNLAIACGVVAAALVCGWLWMGWRLRVAEARILAGQRRENELQSRLLVQHVEEVTDRAVARLVGEDVSAPAPH